MLVCIADIHISHKSDRVFEKNRLELLVEHLKQYKGFEYSLHLLGDTFDSNSPSLEDIRIFYWMMGELSDIFIETIIIPGNHDWKVFNYLPEVNFKYINVPTTIGEITYLPWTHLEEFITPLTMTKGTIGRVVLTHARCTISPHIVEEANLKVLSDRYDLVVLGDIHIPYSPFPNTHYTSEPSQHHHKTYKKNTTGYIIINKSYEIERVYTDLPYKCKLPECSYSDLDKLLPTLQEYNRYKITVKDHVTNLQKLKKIKLSNVKFETIPIVVLSDNSDGGELKDMVSGKVSIEELLFNYVAENYKFSPLIISKIIKAIK